MREKTDLSYNLGCRRDSRKSFLLYRIRSSWDRSIRRCWNTNAVSVRNGSRFGWIRTAARLGGVVNIIESTGSKLGSGRSPATQRCAGPTGGPRPARAGRPGRRSPPDAAPGHRGEVACDVVGAESPTRSERSWRRYAAVLRRLLPTFVSPRLTRKALVGRHAL